MTRINPEQGSIFDADSTPYQGVQPVPVGLRAEGLSKVLGFYDSMGKTNVPETHQRLHKVGADVFAKAYGKRELITSGIDEETASQMASDYYYGRNDSGYNPGQISFLQRYIGKSRKPARRTFQQVLGAEMETFPTESLVTAPQVPDRPPVRTVLDEGKVILPRHSEVVQAGIYTAVGAEDKITLGRLIRLAGEGIDEPWQHEEPSIPLVKHGLYISPRDPRFRRAELLVRVGVDLDSDDPGNVGVVFPPEEFRIVARSPRDLVRHMQAVTRRANAANGNRDDVTERTGRAAGHVLTEKIFAMTALSTTLEAQRDFLRKMYKELGSAWIAHYLSKNLEKHRVTVDEMIHDTADVAAVNLNYGSDRVARLHTGIKKKLYGGNRTHAQTSEQWQAYIELVGRYIGMRLLKVSASIDFCEGELVAYQPFLDRKQEAA